MPQEIRIDGRAATIEAAIEAAAAALAGAQRPLVIIAPEITTEAQRLAIAVGDALRAEVDGATSDSAAAGILVAQRRGRAAATLGEIRNRADVVLFWAVDPRERYPRYLERYAAATSATHVRRRALLSVSIGGDRGPAKAEIEAEFAAGEEVDALAVMQATVRGRGLGELPPGLRPAVTIAERLMAAKYVAIVHDAETGGEARDAQRTESLVALAQALNGPTRAVLSSLRAGGNRSGAEAALTWQTGYPTRVSFRDGYPRSRPGRSGLDRLRAGEADAVLVAGSVAALADSGFGLGDIPGVLIGPGASAVDGARVAIDTGVAGIHESGTGYRMDDVPLALTTVIGNVRGAAATSGPAAGRGPARRAEVAVSDRSRLRITGGAVHDPANGVDGEVRDICIEDGRIVASLPAGAPTLDARGMVVMPGGVDIHAHFASSSCNHARRLIPDEHAADPAPAPPLRDGESRSGSGGTVPSTFTTGYRYAGLGYTTAFEAAAAPLLARHSHAELDDTPCVDGGIFALMGNDEYLLRQIELGEHDRARDYAAWLLGAAGAYAVKIVNPGGVEAWKAGQRNVTGLDDQISGRKVTPRAILETLTDAANRLGLPHPVHIHCNNLGVAGNAATTLASMETLAGRRAHFTHLQFHCYGGEPGKAWSSAAAKVMDYVNAHPEVSVDVGQVMFGPAMTITADAPVEYLLHKSSGRRWTNIDIELESGCGIVPLAYKEKAAVSALQWVVGLELFLLSQDPWRVVLSTDHPNGGSFLSYPALIQLLMDRAVRDDKLRQVSQRHLAGSALTDGLAREYTLNEIAIVTRAGPARLLGLRDKGHLGAGADADVTLYARDPDIARMFSTPRYVVKAGSVIVEEGQLRRAPVGKRLRLAPGYDDAIVRDLRRHFEAYSTVSFDNYPVRGLRDAPMAIP